MISIDVLNRILLLLFVVPSAHICWVDLKRRRIPNLSVAAGVLLLIAGRMLFPRPRWDITVVLEVLASFVLFYLIRLFTRNRLGTGDVKYSAMIAAFIGFPLWFAAILLSSLSGLLVGFSLILMKKINLETKLPFAPFLAFGALTAFFIREHVMKVFSGFLV